MRIPLIILENELILNEEFYTEGFLTYNAIYI